MEINLHGVSKYFQKNLALDHVSLDFKQQKIYALVGPNGSGKSTLLQILALLQKPTSGDLTCNGKLSQNLNNTNYLRNLGYLHDNSIHWEMLSGYENVWFFAKQYGIKSQTLKEKIKELFQWMNLWDKRNQLVSTYSFGMRRKLSLIEVLIHDPGIILLDEPTIGLDYEARLRLNIYLKEKAKANALIILATNNINEAHTVDKIAFINRGKIIKFDRPEAIMKSLDTFVKMEVILDFPIKLDFLHHFEEIKYSQFENELKDENGMKNQFKIQILLKPKNYGQSSQIAAKIIHEIANHQGIILNFHLQHPELTDLFLKQETMLDESE